MSEDVRPAITPEQMSRIAIELLDHFDAERGRYLSGSSDQAVAEAIGVPWGWVARVRDIMGMAVRSAEPFDVVEKTEAVRDGVPTHGAKGDFVKVTVMLSPDVYSRLSDEARRRKLSHRRDPTISAVVNLWVMLGAEMDAEARRRRTSKREAA